MKKKNLKSLKLNKKSISNLKTGNIKGGGITDNWLCVLTELKSIYMICIDPRNTAPVNCPSHNRCSDPCELPPPPPNN